MKPILAADAVRCSQRRPRITPARIGPAGGLALGALVCLWGCGLAFGKNAGDDDDATAKTPPQFPTTYLDLRTIYTTLPANTLALGFSNPSVVANLPALSSPASRSLGVDMPLTVDLNDRVTVYGGVSASMVQAGSLSWTSLAISSWNVGIQADVYKQEGGQIPTITVQTTFTRAIPDAPLATTTTNTLVEADYALNKDETRGLLAGVQYTRVNVDTALASVNPYIVGYLGAYYQWDNNWKFTGRAGVQSFGGAQVATLTPFAAFTQPIVRLDLDRMDDHDNRLFGVTAQIAWTPKPSYQLTLRTPLYLVRN